MGRKRRILFDGYLIETRHAVRKWQIPASMVLDRVLIDCPLLADLLTGLKADGSSLNSHQAAFLALPASQGRPMRYPSTGFNG